MASFTPLKRTRMAPINGCVNAALNGYLCATIQKICMALPPFCFILTDFLFGDLNDSYKEKERGIAFFEGENVNQDFCET